MAETQAPSSVVLAECRVLDVVAGSLGEELQDVWIDGASGRIVEIARHDVRRVSACSSTVLDCGRRTVLPGLCDAHVHVTACTADLTGLTKLPESLVAVRAARVLEGMLRRGFTTVRDAGGADWGLAAAVEEGAVAGPRLLFTGHALSQTGGHGDMRGRGEGGFACACAGLRGIGRVCDGVPEVRRAARDELRKGAHCIKVMASGGVSSPTDALASTQFSREELAAIVEEATACGTYVAAHAYMPSAIRRAVECGVRSVEHGNHLDRATAGARAGRLSAGLDSGWLLGCPGSVFLFDRVSIAGCGIAAAGVAE